MSHLVRWGLPLAAMTLAAMAGRLVAGSTSTFNAWLALFLGAAVAIHVLLLPASWLPSMALALHVLVPAPEIPLAPKLTPSVAVVILLIWVVRRLTERYQAAEEHIVLDWRVLGLPGLVTTWFGFSLLLSSDTLASLGWLFAFATGVLLFTVVPVDRRDSDLLLRTWVIAAVLLAGHVLVESLLQDDFLYGWFYQQLGVESVQHWSMYRPEASFRHPLSAALFLATGSAVALGEAVRRSHGPYFFASAVCAFSATLTLTRSALVALVVGAVVVWLQWHPREFSKFSPLRHTSALALALLLVWAVNVGPLAARLDSVEASRSTDTRTEIFRVAVETSLAGGPLGTGPGTSQRAVASVSELPIESSLLQLMVSTGVIGLVLFMALMADILRRGVRARAVGAVAGLATYLTAVSLFNVFEAKTSLLVLCGLLILATRQSTQGSAETGLQQCGGQPGDSRKASSRARI